ncbi:hypothetical protein Bbelb_213530 [Branchiostoma belcheri]|nr:hypothetical protein Bbelb_213530 [Branchiostoma belcheri]
MELCQTVAIIMFQGGSRLESSMVIRELVSIKPENYVCVYLKSLCFLQVPSMKKYGTIANLPERDIPYSALENGLVWFQGHAKDMVTPKRKVNIQITWSLTDVPTAALGSLGSPFTKTNGQVYSSNLHWL